MGQGGRGFESHQAPAPFVEVFVRIGALTTIVCLLSAVPAQATTHEVTTAAEFQTALGSLACGDIVKLAAGTEFIGTGQGGFVLPAIGDCSANPVIIESDASPANLPASGHRTGPAYEAFLPKIRSDHEPTELFAVGMYVEQGANGYILRHLEFTPGIYGYWQMLAVGDGDETHQHLTSQQPRNIVVDRVYVNGYNNTDTPYALSNRGVYLGGINLTVKDSYFTGIDSPMPSGDDSAAIVCLNGAGPYTITGNYFEGGTYSIICGGGGIGISTRATITGTPTTTTADLTWAAWGNQPSPGDAPVVGQFISIEHSTATAVCHGTVTAYTPATATTGTVEWTPACSATPDASGDVRWGVQPADITIERNHFERDLANVTAAIVPTPENFTATPSTGGAVPDGTYDLYVFAIATGQREVVIWSHPSSVQQAVVSAGGSGRINVSWDEVTGADQGYTVYMQLPDDSWQIFNYAAGTLSAMIDTDDGDDRASLPDGHIRKWKNALEIKIGDGVSIKYNVIDVYAPTAEDSGYAIWLKNENQPSGCNTPFQIGRDYEVAYNLLRDVFGFVLMTGNSPECLGTGVAPALTGVNVHDNIVIRSNASQQIGSLNPSAILVAAGPADVTFNHNTLDHTVQAFFQLHNTSGLPECEGLTVTNNLAFRNTYGVLKTGSPGDYTSVTDALDGECSMDWTFAGNVVAGPQESSYADGTWPMGNFLPATTAALEDEFVDYAGGDFALDAMSTYANAGTDGEDIGADVAAVLLGIDGVEDGEPAAAGGGRPLLRLLTR